MNFQELSRADNGNAAKCPELPKMPIPGNNNIGAGLKSAFEDAIVRFVLRDRMNRFLGFNELGEPLNGCNSLSGSRGRPLELGK